MVGVNIDGIDGPILKKIFTCENCKFLGETTFSGYGVKNPYRCYHPDIIKDKLNATIIATGDISDNKITPNFCPYILRKMRNEKLKELDEASKR